MGTSDQTSGEPRASSEQLARATSASFSPVVVAPTYNNAGTLLDILGRVVALGLPVIVVDDGCTDGTAGLLERWRAADVGRAAAVEVVRHHRNLGKAQAMLTGFAAAAARGHTHGATIDTDGQLDPESIPALLAVAARVPGALVLGVRADQIEGCPGRSLVGRKLSNLAIRCECGVRVQDSQCGLRVYPLDLVAGENAARCRAGRFAFEAEIITRAAWAGRPIEQVPAPCRYLLEETRISHFRPWRDSLHGIRLHARLLGAALLPRRRPGSSPDVRSALPPEGVWRRARVWLSPVRLWRQIRQDPGAPTEVALGVGLGVFIANLPLYGVQTVLSLYVAQRLHMHPLPVVAGSQASTPPLGVLLIAAAIAVGHLLLHGTWVWTDMAQATTAWPLVRSALLDWVVGSVIVGGASAVAALALTLVLLRSVSRRAARRQTTTDS